MRTQIAILGAGPAGLLLARLLQREGIDFVVLERRSRDYVESRIRAGVLEQGTVDMLREAAAADRLDREGMVHEGVKIRFARHHHRIDLRALSGGKAITVYGQHEVVKDLIKAILDDGGRIEFEAEAAAIEGIETENPLVRYRRHGAEQALHADFVAGCDGSHGLARTTMPEDRVTRFERSYPFAWLGILAEAPPTSDELIYAHHEMGFALYSMRSPELTRLYIQVDAGEALENWPDRRIWDALHERLEVDEDWHIVEGPIVQRGIAPMRSIVTEPMRHGRLFLAGDAAHIVPPTGAKGMNLAVADIRNLWLGLKDFYSSGAAARLDRYSAACLDRIWKVQRFSWWMTGLLHRFPESSAFEERIQAAELAYLTSSEAARTTLAENYVGLPFA